MNEFQQAGMGQAQGMGQPQFGPQGLFGGMFGAPIGSAIGRGIGNMFNNPNLGSRIGEIAGGIGGSLLPFGADPAAQQQMQLQQQLQQLQQLQQMQQMQQLQQLQQQQGQQLAPQGFFGGLIQKYGKPAGNLLGSVTGNATLGNVVGGLSGLGGLLPFSADAQGGGQQAAIVQQLQQLQMQHQQLQQALQQVQQQAAVLQQQLSQQAQQTQQQAGQGQLAPQGWLSNMIGQYAQPVGSFIGGQLGNQQLGSTIGGIAGQLGSMLPFSADPWSAYAQAQQAQLASQQTVH